MANAQVPRLANRRLSKSAVKRIILVMLLIFIVVFAYFFWKGRNPADVMLNNVGPVSQPTPLFGIYGSGKMGTLRKPMAVTVYDRRIFVSDTDNQRVAVFDYNGNPLFTFGKRGTDKGQFQFPYGIVADNSGLVYVADLYNGNIQVFDQNGKFIKYFVDPKANLFMQPAGLFFYNNKIYLADVAKNEVLAFDLDGKKVLEFGKKGTGPGELSTPNAVAVSGDRIFVSDTGNARVQVFDQTGKLLAINTGDEPKVKNSLFVNNRGVGVDGRGTLFVVSNLTSKIFAFDKNGHKPYPPFGSPGNEDTQFQLPNGLFIDNQGRLYFTDTMNQRVMVYQD